MALIAESQTAFHDPNAITLLIEVISAMIARYWKLISKGRHLKWNVWPSCSHKLKPVRKSNRNK